MVLLNDDGASRVAWVGEVAKSSHGSMEMTGNPRPRSSATWESSRPSRWVKHEHHRSVPPGGGQCTVRGEPEANRLAKPSGQDNDNVLIPDDGVDGLDLLRQLPRARGAQTGEAAHVRRVTGEAAAGRYFGLHWAQGPSDQPWRDWPVRKVEAKVKFRLSIGNTHSNTPCVFPEVGRNEQGLRLPIHSLMPIKQ